MDYQVVDGLLSLMENIFPFEDSQLEPMPDDELINPSLDDSILTWRLSRPAIRTSHWNARRTT